VQKELIFPGGVARLTSGRDSESSPNKASYRAGSLLSKHNKNNLKLKKQRTGRCSLSARPDPVRGKLIKNAKKKKKKKKKKMTKDSLPR